MASVFLGLDDLDFVKPTAADLTRRSNAVAESDTIVIRTTAGNVTALLARDTAPNVALQVTRLAAAGVFNNVATQTSGSHVDITIASTDAVRRLLQPLNSDRGVPPERGTIAYCMPTKDANKITLRIFLDVTTPDERCIGFGRIASGSDVLRAIHKAPPGVSAFVLGVTPRKSEGRSVLGSTSAFKL
jgi:cyclophilin family peptidyl-prolyl cis-trans isomerase